MKLELALWIFATVMTVSITKVAADTREDWAAFIALPAIAGAIWSMASIVDCVVRMAKL